MNLAGTNSKTKSPLHISNVEPRFGSTKLTAGAPPTRAFCECVGVCAIRAALILAVLSALILIAALPAQAQTETVGAKKRTGSETVLYNFCSQPNCSDGAGPQSSLIFDGAGNPYGTTNGGGLFGYGTVFELSPNGSGGWNETVLYSFTGGADGANPTYSNLIFDSLGNLYGTAYGGGATGNGAVFELSPVGAGWMETVLYSFANDGDGANPTYGLIFDPAGNLYGTNSAGVFELSPSGGGWTGQVIYSTSPSAGLTMDASGNIFGVTSSTVFEASPNGSGGWNPTVIHTFSYYEGGGSVTGTPVLDQAGDLYGATSLGGNRALGTVYKLTPVEKGKTKGEWKEEILHSFRGLRSGFWPFAGVVLDVAGDIYGTTTAGGRYEVGTVFELVALPRKGAHKFEILWSFNQQDGWLPGSSLILDSAGNLYGTAASLGDGLVFEVTP